jgi:hypothetical protein
LDVFRLDDPERQVASGEGDEVRARRHAFAFADAISRLERHAAEIVAGGESYSADVRKAARQLMPSLAGARFRLVSGLRRASDAATGENV